MLAGWLALSLGSSGCSTAISARQTAAVRQAVFNQQISYWLAEHARESGVVVCLGTSEDGRTKGVDASVLAELGDRAATRSAEECVASPAGAIERSTSRPAVIITVAGVTWRSRDEAVVEVEHFRSATMSGRRKYRVVREAGAWVCLGPVVEMTPA
jgi:hypothetical protein